MKMIRLPFLALAAALALSFASAQDESLAGSFLSGLLDSITTTEDSKDCPGVCVHVLATLICYEVLDDVSCPSAGMKCCVENAQSVNTSSTTTAPLTKAPKVTKTTKASVKTSVAQDSSNDKCPGDCIADRIADYCEAYFKTPKNCGSGKKCCITKDAEYSPEDIIIPLAYKNGTSPGKIAEAMSEATKSTSPALNKKKPKPSQKVETITTTTEANSGEEKPCKGECVAGLFALFCDDIDSDAYCPGEASCCVKSEDGDNNYIEQKPSTTTQPSRTKPPSKPTKSQYPKCPGFCMLYIMAAFCERPSVLIPNTSNCNSGSVCCDNTRSGNVKTRPPPKRPLTTNPTTTTPPPVTTTLVPDPREECPGTCLVSLLSFTCFRNAEMTELFKCKKPGTQCCAPKSRILEVQTRRNDTLLLSQGSILQPYDHYPATPIPQILQFTSFSYENQQTTTTPRQPVYSKYVCGVKGTKRSSKKKREVSVYPAYQDSSFERDTRKIGDLDDASLYLNKKSNERLILGSSLVPIPIIYHDVNDTIPIDLKYSSYQPTKNYSAYSSRQGRVVGGEDGENGEWCWQVALINSLNQYLCGAALIGTQWVLTAAHCVTNIVRSGDAIYVRVGDYDLTRKYGSPGAQTLRVATTYIHHNHNSQTLDNDIALLKLHGQAELRDGVCLVCLPARGVNHAAGQRCTVTGYGYMGESGPIPLRVREAEIPIVSDTECIRKVNAVTEKIFILPASSFCAGGEEGNDACQGDGGGGLACQDDGFYELVGLVSWGFGCGRLDVPGVYVKVSSFIGWINQIISVNNV